VDLAPASGSAVSTRGAHACQLAALLIVAGLLLGPDANGRLVYRFLV
jgi:hypothetical protein